MAKNRVRFTHFLVMNQNIQLVHLIDGIVKLIIPMRE